MQKTYYKEPYSSTKILLELINEFSKAAGYKINIQKSVAFLSMDDELSEREIKNMISFKIVSKIKYLGINLNKEVKNLYSINYKSLKKKQKVQKNEVYILFLDSKN